MRAWKAATSAIRTATHLPEGAAHFDSFTSQAAYGDFCEGTLCPLCSLDQTAHFLLAACNIGRSWPKQVGAHSGKCPLTTATHRAQASGETTSMHESRSSPVLATWDIRSKTSRERAVWNILPVMGIRRKGSEWRSSLAYFYRTDIPSSQYSSPATFHLTPGSHWPRHWLSTRRARGGQTTGRAMVRGAGLEETLDQRSSPRNLSMRKLKMEPVQAPKQRKREDNVESHTIPRRLKYETCRAS